MSRAGHPRRDVRVWSLKRVVTPERAAIKFNLNHHTMPPSRSRAQSTRPLYDDEEDEDGEEDESAHKGGSARHGVARGEDPRRSAARGRGRPESLLGIVAA